MNALGTQHRSPEVRTVWTGDHSTTHSQAEWDGGLQPNRSCCPLLLQSQGAASLPCAGGKEHGRSLQDCAATPGGGQGLTDPVPDNEEWLTFHWDFAAEGGAASLLLGRSAACDDQGTGLGLLPCREIPFSQLDGCSSDCHHGKVSADRGRCQWPVKPPLPAHRGWWGCSFPGPAASLPTASNSQLSRAMKATVTTAVS